MKHCVIYARLAVEDEQELNKQVVRLVEIAEQKGFLVDKVFTDFGSGMKINPGLKDLMQEIKEGKIQFIFARDITRFARLGNIWADVANLCIAKKAWIVCP